jgi:hypothetical protein
MTWNYRLIQIGEDIGLYEVYYNENLDPIYRMESPTQIVFDLSDNINEVSHKIFVAFLKKVLTDDDFVKDERVF